MTEIIRMKELDTPPKEDMHSFIKQLQKEMIDKLLVVEFREKKHYTINDLTARI